MNYHRKEIQTAYILLLPVICIVALFILLPVIGALYNSFFRDVTYLPKKFIGIENFIWLLSNPDFHRALLFTLLFTCAAVVLETLLGLLFALMLNESFKGRGYLRTIILVPWAIPTIVSAKIWNIIFNYSYGVLNYIVISTGLVPERINWLGTSSAAFAALVIAEVWKTTPFMVLIILAGLQAIPQELYYQARIDGAGVFKRFFAITLIMIRPVLVIALIFRTIDSLRIFDLVYVLTGGGPGGSTRTLSMLGFENYLADSFGRGSAISIATFLVVFGITLFYIRAGKFSQSIRQK
ncbi:MAG: ABC transporter permease subunit [Chitinivibrionales bacterium]|nr:ABC transporter permease subunit [Chitinivibrionales bacterium]